MEIKVSVRGLVEFLLRTGDIDNRKNLPRTTLWRREAEFTA